MLLLLQVGMVNIRVALTDDRRRLRIGVVGRFAAGMLKSSIIVTLPSLGLLLLLLLLLLNSTP